MLLHAGGGRRSRSPADDAGRLWYPLWDGGFVLGHSVRTVKEALDLADADLDAMTALLDVRLIAGDRGLVDELEAKIRRLVPGAAGAWSSSWRPPSRAREDRPGPIAEMLAPDLKNGAGGLRDVQSAGWVGWALEPGAGRRAGLGRWRRHARRPRLPPGRRSRSASPAASARLLEARVALHRVTNGKSDQLALQDQDAVARLVGAADADVLVRSLGESARAVTWITSDLWARLLASEEGPRHRVTGPARPRRRDQPARRPHRVRRPTRELDGTRVLALAARAAEQGAQFERETLNRIAAVEIVEWTDDARDAFIALLAHRPQRDRRLRDPRSRRCARAPVARVGARAGAAAAQRVPPLHRRPALARSRGRVRGAPRSRRSGRARAPTATSRGAPGPTCCC